MRILLVVRSCQGGMKNHVANLVAGLTEQGHQVFVAGGGRRMLTGGGGKFALDAPIQSNSGVVRTF